MLLKTNKEILALEVTDEKSYDGKVMPRLIEHILKRKDNKGQKEFHRLAKKQQIEKQRSQVSNKRSLNGKRKEDMDKDGQLTVFSSIKRMFGEYVLQQLNWKTS